MRARARFIAWTVLGIGVVLAEHAWLVLRTPGLPEPQPPRSGRPAGVTVPGGDFPLPDAPTASASAWPEPQAQERGEGWCFEVFEPPPMWRLSESALWSLTPPARQEGDPALGKPVEPEFGIEVVAIVRQLFPVQLVGFGQTQGGEPFGIFENASDGDTVVARRGSALGGTAHVVEEVRLVCVQLGDPEGRACPLMVAEAQVSNALTGARTALSTRERKFVGDPWIRYRVTGSSEIVTAQPLSSLSLGSMSYRIAAVRPAEGSVEVIRDPDEGGVPNMKTFRVPVVHSLQETAVAVAQSGLERRPSAAMASNAKEQSFVQ